VRSKPQEIKERAQGLRKKAAEHKKSVRFHRRQLKECLTQAQKYEEQLARMGIKLEIQKKSL